MCSTPKELTICKKQLSNNVLNFLVDSCLTKPSLLKKLLKIKSESEENSVAYINIQKFEVLYFIKLQELNKENEIPSDL